MRLISGMMASILRSRRCGSQGVRQGTLNVLAFEKQPILEQQGFDWGLHWQHFV